MLIFLASLRRWLTELVIKKREILIVRNDGVGGKLSWKFVENTGSVEP